MKRVFLTEKAAIISYLIFISASVSRRKIPERERQLEKPPLKNQVVNAWWGRELGEPAQAI